MFGDGSTLNNALMSAIATTNFSDVFAAMGAVGGSGAPPPAAALSNFYASPTAPAARALSSAEAIFEQLARRQQQQQKLQQQALIMVQEQAFNNSQQHHQQQRQQQKMSKFLSAENSSREVCSNNVFSTSPHQRQQQLQLPNNNVDQILLSPPPQYSEAVAMSALARPSSAATTTAAAMSPDIVRLAADTTAVTLRDDNEDTSHAVPSAFVRPQPGPSHEMVLREKGTTNSTRHDEPLDLSLRKNQKSSTRNLIGPCASSPSPSNSSISSFDSNSNASTPSKPSMLHGNYGCRAGEVKRSASSVTHRHNHGADFDADVAEHFRRSLSGKWPRRQLNYAHYVSPTCTSGSSSKGNGTRSLNESSNSLAANGAAGMSASTARLADRFLSINELRAVAAATGGVSPAPVAAGGESADVPTSLPRIFAEKFDSNVFARKNSLTARYVPQKVPQNLSGLAPSSKIIWRKKSSASVQSNTTQSTQCEYNNGNVSDITPCASPYGAGSPIEEMSQSQPQPSSSKLTPGTSRKASTKNSIIIINQAQDVEDHFRMALGDQAFQRIKRAQSRAETPQSGSAADVPAANPFLFSSPNSIGDVGNILTNNGLASSTRL